MKQFNKNKVRLLAIDVLIMALVCSVMWLLTGKVDKYFITSALFIQISLGMFLMGSQEGLTADRGFAVKIASATLAFRYLSLVAVSVIVFHLVLGINFTIYASIHGILFVIFLTYFLVMKFAQDHIQTTDDDALSAAKKKRALSNEILDIKSLCNQINPEIFKEIDKMVVSIEEEIRFMEPSNGIDEVNVDEGLYKYLSKLKMELNVLSDNQSKDVSQFAELKDKLIYEIGIRNSKVKNLKYS